MYDCESVGRSIFRHPSIKLLFLAAFAAALFSAFPVFAVELARINVSDAAASLDTMIFLDARPENEWKKGHIPESRSFSWETYTRTDPDGVKYRTIPPEELAEKIGRLGIRHTDAVVIYGDAETSWGGEGWAAWVFARLGHQGRIYCLDGGFPLWQAKGLPVSDAPATQISPKKYSIHTHPDFTISALEIMARKNEITLVDTRNYFSEWLPGHLPNAIHISWKNFYQGPHRSFLSPDDLENLLVKNHVDLRKPVVYYCTGGIRSGFTWMVHQLAGLPDAMNFEGGTEEWNHFQKIAASNRKRELSCPAAGE